MNILAGRDLAALCESRFGEPDLARQWAVSTLVVAGVRMKWPANETELARAFCSVASTRLGD